MADNMQTTLNPELIRIEIDEIQRSIQHLIRSNQELLEASPPDPIYNEAIIENKDVIKRKEERIAKLRERLEQCCGSHASGYGEAPIQKSQPVYIPESGPNLEDIQDGNDDRENEGLDL